MDFITAHCPAAVFAFHAMGSICGHKFLAASAGAADAAYKESCGRLTTAYGGAMAPEFRPDADLEFTCAAGSLPAWCSRELRIPAFDVEMSATEPARAACVKDRVDTALLADYQERHARGLRAVLEMLAS